jgi:hypothetical protein
MSVRSISTTGVRKKKEKKKGGTKMLPMGFSTLNEK